MLYNFFPFFFCPALHVLSSKSVNQPEGSHSARHSAILPVAGPRTHCGGATVVHQSRASVDHVAVPRDDDRASRNARIPDGLMPPLARPSLPPSSNIIDNRPWPCSAAPACNCRCNVARREYNC